MAGPIPGKSSRVARRIHLSFVLAAGLPLLVLALTSYLLVSDRLQSQAAGDARALAKDFGMGIFDRLKFINDQLNILVRQVNASYDALPTVDGLDLEDRTRGLFRMSANGSVTGPVALTAPERDTIGATIALRDRTKPVLVAVGEAAAKRLFLLVAARPAAQSGDWYGAELSNHHLWNSTGIAERIERVCVLDPQRMPVFCNHGDYDSWLAAVRPMMDDRTRSAKLSHDNGEQVLTAFWSLFLKPHYQFDNWTVVVGVPESLALASIRSFDRLFFGAGALGVLIAFMLGRRLIRSNLEPLADLSRATERLSSGDFQHRVRLESDDEFQQLGDAFDQMAARIGDQFTELQTLASLDRALQRAQTVEDALGAAAQALDGLVGSGCFALLCHEHWTQPQSICVRGFDSVAVTRFDLAPGDADAGQSAAAAIGAAASRQRLGAAAGERLQYVPVLDNEQVSAEIVLRGAQPDNQALVGRIADVLAIALTNLVMERRLFHQANHDWLSGLPNRLRLRDLFQQWTRVQGDDTRLVGMLLVGLDRFKQVNDSLGHTLGDRLLAAVGDRLRTALPDDVILSRFAGDQFVIMLKAPDLQGLMARLTGLAGELSEQLDRPFTIGLRDIRLSATIGAALYPKDGDGFESMLQSLDAASYAAKSSRRGGLLFFSSGMRDALAGRMDMEQALKGAVANDELRLHFQPVVDSQTRQVVSAEALMRWQRPGVGLVMPGEFIEVAEQSGLIGEMGHWAIREVCRQMQRWRNAGLAIDTVTVNVSSVQLGSDQLIDQVAAALRDTGLPPRALTLEVTETALIGRFEEGVERLKQLRALGVRILVDDFGTGYASFKYLKMLPIDGLKIDRLFVKDLPASSRDAAIVQAVASLARASGFKVVAEGIDTEAQATFLRDAGIRYLQGYLFARGLTLREFEARLQPTAGPQHLEALRG